MLKKILILIVIAFSTPAILFLVWMNFTPGHFQHSGGCCNEIRYITNTEIRKPTNTCYVVDCGYPNSFGKLIESVLVNSAILDFNK